MTSTLPTPGDALQTSINYFDTGDRDGARYWLDVARELRQGQHPAEPAAPSDSDGTMRIIPGYAESDATAVLNAVAGPDAGCPSCGAQLIPFEGGLVHRSTYRKECEFATAGR